jgi:hypothetical protein
MKCDGHHGVREGGKVGADVGGGRKGGCKMFEILFLEATVDVTAQVGKAEGAVCEVGERGNLLSNFTNGGEMGLKEGRAGGTKEATLSTRFGTPCK